MNVSHFTLDYEEKVSETFVMPTGRRVEAKLELLPSVPAGPSPREPDTLTLIVEAKKRGAPDTEFAEIARTKTLSEAGVTQVLIPDPEQLQAAAAQPQALEPAVAGEVLPAGTDDRAAPQPKEQDSKPAPALRLEDVVVYVGRLRLIHTGRLMPRFHADLIGL